ncbi:hypothetical protein POM88_010371 [Heracleum sosnowskyi]|uniref:Uncharacterized protein n=1 Tax=Heracleum sosnowskyi TaxID=360622 RepID=A0AAD8ITC3_9APIA|nr:hypothetical protein POM88_010367 [Heracleum sosnowskyi]KAK1391315.1 hypothetical protein POM88_010371 [Heracleum sosnowskyi]
MLVARRRLATKVQDTKCAKWMPFLIALSDTLNNLCWCIYATLGSDNPLRTLTLSLTMAEIHSDLYPHSPSAHSSRHRSRGHNGSHRQFRPPPINENHPQFRPTITHRYDPPINENQPPLTDPPAPIRPLARCF